MRQLCEDKKCIVCNERAFGLFQDKEDRMCLACHMKLKHARHPHILYLYNDFFKQLLFQYKGLGDLALAPIFLEEYRAYLKKKYKGYTIVCVPSNTEDNLRRGFAFLPWMFKSLGLPILSPFTKLKPYKQSSSKARKDIEGVIALKDFVYLKDKKILLVDDVMTSGYTILTCLNLLESLHPKKLDYLVLASRAENISENTKLLKERGKRHERKSKKI